MPKFNYSGFVTTAKRLIDKFGRDMQLLVIANGGDEWNPVQTETAQDFVGVATQFAANEIDGDLIQRADRRYLLSAAIEPTTANRLRDGGIDYSIVNVVTIGPGDRNIIYKVQARL